MTNSRAQFPTISKPVFIGEFKTDHEITEVHPGRSNIRYLHEPLVQQKRVHFDLNHGFETFRAKPCDGRIDGLLKYIMSVSEPGSNLQKILHDCQFVTWRGTLTKVAASPFLAQNSDPWAVACCRFNNVIFLCEQVTDEKRSKQANENEFHKKATYWGHKFEQYLTKDTSDSEPNTSEPVSTFEDYSAVFKLHARSQKGNPIDIFLGAETDGIDGRGNFVELKTQFQKLGIGQFWPEKQMKWWIQSYLVGIERLIVGLRDRVGVVEELQEVSVQELRQSRSGWEPAICMNYLFDFLDNIRKQLEELPEGRILMAEYKPTTKLMRIRELQENQYQTVNFIPDYFIQHFTNE